MPFSRLLDRLSVRGKVNLALAPVIVLTVAIAGLSFVSHRNGSITDAGRIIGLILDSGAKQVATVFDEQSDLLVDWAADDAWGVSIEVRH